MFRNPVWIFFSLAYMPLQFVNLLAESSDPRCLSLSPEGVSGPGQLQNSVDVVVQFSHAWYSPGQVIAVTLTSYRPFGLLLQARSLSTVLGNTSVGHFLAPLPRGVQVLSCSPINGTVSSNGTKQSSYTLIWQAPEVDQGNIGFRASYVFNRTTYWRNVLVGKPLEYQQNQSTTVPAPTTMQCAIVTCRCHGRAKMVKDRFGCIISCECQYPCPPSSFQCKSGQCITKSFQCDGELDCEDGTDENGCPSQESDEDDYDWRTPGRNAAVGVAIVVVLVIFTYFMYRRYTMLYHPQGMIAVMAGPAWYRRPSQRERARTRMEIINAILETENVNPSSLPPYSPRDSMDVSKPPPSYVQACGLPPPVYTDVTSSHAALSSETVIANTGTEAEVESAQREPSSSAS